MTTPETDDQPGAPTPRKQLSLRAQRRLLLVSAVVAVVLALVGGATAFGWWLATNSVVASSPNPEPTVIEVPIGSGTIDDVLMPDVRGLSLADSLQVLTDAGIPVAIITASERAVAGTSGLVVEQTPVFGTAAPASVALVISAPAVVPDVVGLSTSDAIDRLVELGVQIEQVGIYDPAAVVDTVQSIEPATGSALPESVVLTVATAPSSAYFFNLVSTGGCYPDSAMLMNGVTYSEGLTCSSSTDGNDISWQLNKAVATVAGVVGVPDSAAVGSKVRIQFFGDDKPLYSSTLRYGSTESIALDTTGVLKLTVRVTDLDESYTSAGIGDLVATGSSDGIAGLPR